MPARQKNTLKMGCEYHYRLYRCSALHTLLHNSHLCKCMISDNLIHEEGIKKIIDAVDYQTTIISFSEYKRLGPGLMRVVLHVGLCMFKYDI